MSPLFQPSFSVAAQRVPDFEIVGVLGAEKQSSARCSNGLYITVYCKASYMQFWCENAFA